MDIKIRLAEEKDLDFIKEINQSNQKSVSYENPEWFFKEKIRTNKVITAEKDNKCLGYLVFHILWGNSPFIALVKVKKEEQGQGIGKKLMNFAFEHFKKQGYDFVLSSSEEKNIGGRNFHKKIGFAEAGSFDGVEESEIFFKKNL